MHAACATACGSEPSGASGGASTMLRSILRPLMPPQRSLIRPTNFSAWSAGSPIGIANPMPSRSSSVTRICVTEIESAVMPSSVAFGASSGCSVAGSQNESSPAKRLRPVDLERGEVAARRRARLVGARVVAVGARGAVVVVTPAARGERQHHDEEHRRPADRRTDPGTCAHDVPPLAGHPPAARLASQTHPARGDKRALGREPLRA